MPILDPKYLSSWYFFTANDGNNTPYLFESWNEDEVQDLEKKKLMQGDIGTHVMRVGGQKYPTSIKSPVLFIEQSLGNSYTYDVFSLMLLSFGQLQSPNPLPYDYILSKAVIDITEKGIDCSLDYLSDTPGAFNAQFGPKIDFIGRTAVNYDTVFVTDELAQLYTDQYPAYVEKGRMELTAEITENYFIGGTQKPIFGIGDYRVKGSISIIVPYENFYYAEIVKQKPGQFISGANETLLQVGTESLSFGSLRMHSKISRNLAAGQPCRISIDFESFARATYPS